MPESEHHLRGTVAALERRKQPLNRRFKMSFELIADVPRRFLALLLLASLPFSPAFALEENDSSVSTLKDSPAAVAASSCAAKADVTTIVPARPSESLVAQTSDWKDSGIVVDGCHALRVSAAGQWHYGEVGVDPPVSADGTRGLPCDRNDKTGINDSPLPSAPCGALVGKVGPNGKPFFIGVGPTEVPLGSQGVLFFIINDWEYGDNSGSLTVTTSFRSPPSTAKR